MSPQELSTLWAMACVGGYVLSTAPFLVLIPLAHRSRTEGRPWLLTGTILQLLPVGLIFFPLGLVGAAVLGGAWVAILRRNRLFAKAAIPRPDLAEAWRLEALVAGWGTGLAFQQKAFAFAFLEGASGQGGWPLALALAGALLLFWLPLLLWLRGAHRAWREAAAQAPAFVGAWHSPAAP